MMQKRYAARKLKLIIQSGIKGKQECKGMHEDFNLRILLHIKAYILGI